MKTAIILAAGKSTRCNPLTSTRPKALLKVADKTLIEHLLDQLQGIVDRVILIVGYKKEMLKEHLGGKYHQLLIDYVEQKEARGTGHALLQCIDQTEGDFIVMYGDDFYAHDDILKLSKHRLGLLVKEHPDPKRFGVVEQAHGKLINIEEKPAKPKSNIVVIGVYKLDTKIFEILKTQGKSQRSEIELPEAVSILAKTTQIDVVKADTWHPTGYPWDLLETNKALLEKMGEDNIQGTVEKGATVKGRLVLGKGSVIKEGSYIEGPVIVGENTTIGPNSYIRGSTSIGSNCKIGQSSEIKNSIIMDNSKVPHLNYVGDSVIGENVNLGAGAIIANLRHDNQNIKSMINGKLVDTGRRKFGAVIGDNVHTGVHTCIYPGRKIWPNKTTAPGEKVTKDIC